MRILREVPLSKNYRLGCRRCGGWGRRWVDNERIECDLCAGSGIDPEIPYATARTDITQPRMEG